MHWTTLLPTTEKKQYRQVPWFNSVLRDSRVRYLIPRVSTQWGRYCSYSITHPSLPWKIRYTFANTSYIWWQFKVGARHSPLTLILETWKLSQRKRLVYFFPLSHVAYTTVDNTLQCSLDLSLGLTDTQKQYVSLLQACPLMQILNRDLIYFSIMSTDQYIWLPHNPCI